MKTRRVFHTIVAIVISLAVFGCSEGGTGGTGGVTPRTSDSNTVSGHVNKGPFETATSVVVVQLDSSGTMTASLTSTLTLSELGDFEFSASPFGPMMVSSTGAYFSEISGLTSGDITLSMIIEPSTASEIHNINLLTTISTPRIQALMAGGTQTAEAITTAEAEVLNIFTDLLGTFDNASGFSHLLLISALQSEIDVAGNGYLLALSSLFEQVAQTRSQGIDSTPADSMQSLLTEVANDIASDGLLSQDALLPELQAAMGEVNPDEILQNLFTLQPSFQEVVLADTSLDGTENVVCEVALDDLECSSTNSSSTFPISDIISDINRFIDTDNDGISNNDDPDDDGDGVPDEEDDTPYAAVPVSSLTPVNSEQAFEDYIKVGLSQWGGTTVSNRDFIGLSPPEALESAAPPAEPFSDLNVQVDGVDESDFARFDGEHIYVANGNQIAILKSDNLTPSTTLINTLVLGDQSHVQGLYLMDSDQADLLVAIGSNYNYTWHSDIVTPWVWRQGTTQISLYDVQDPANAAFQESLNIEGYLVASRRIENLLYVVTLSTPNIPGLISYPQTDAERDTNQALIDSTDLADLLPFIVDGSLIPRPLVHPNNCFLPAARGADLHYPSLITVTAINLQDTSDIKSVCMAENIYGTFVSNNAMYLVSSDFNGNSVATKIHKFAFTSSGPEYRGTGLVEGGFGGDPAYRMGEHNGRLAAVTSNSFNAGHRLTLFEEGEDHHLVESGTLPNASQPATIGKEGEAIYATRILGNRAYIVTFLRTDPVYVIDLEELQILGELEIPGFSSYLHPVSEDLVLGVGKAVEVIDEFPYNQGIKLQLFDVSDPANPVSASEVSIGFRGTDSALTYDPHALAYIKDHGQGVDRFSFPISVHSNGDGTAETAPADEFQDYSHTGLYLFELDKNLKSLHGQGAIKTQDSSCFFDRQRGFVVDGAVHFLLDDRVLSAFWDTPDLATELEIFQDEEYCFFY